MTSPETTPPVPASIRILRTDSDVDAWMSDADGDLYFATADDRAFVVFCDDDDEWWAMRPLDWDDPEPDRIAPVGGGCLVRVQEMPQPVVIAPHRVLQVQGAIEGDGLLTSPSPPTSVAGNVLEVAQLLDDHSPDHFTGECTCGGWNVATSPDRYHEHLARVLARRSSVARPETQEEVAHMRLKAEIESERQRRRDNTDPALTVPVTLRDGDQCRYCGVLTKWRGRVSGRTRTLDHLLDRVDGLGGTTSVDNVVVACVRCSSARQTIPRWDDDHPLRAVPSAPIYGRWAARFLTEYGYPTEANDCQLDVLAPAGTPAERARP